MEKLLVCSCMYADALVVVTHFNGGDDAQYSPIIAADVDVPSYIFMLDLEQSHCVFIEANAKYRVPVWSERVGCINQDTCLAAGINPPNDVGVLIWKLVDDMILIGPSPGPVSSLVVEK